MSGVKKTITIPLEKYIQLLLDEEQLYRLDIGGVDNWEWYGEAMYPEDRLDMEDFERELRKELGAIDVS